MVIQSLYGNPRGDTRIDFGRVLYGYKVHFKARGGWVAAARAIASLVRCSEKTIYRIAHDYERICGLEPVFLEALGEEGIDPAAPKNAQIVSQLFRLSAPVTRDEAARTVATVVREHGQRRRAERATKNTETEQQKSRDSNQQAEEATENESEPVGQMLDANSTEREKATDEFALQIVDTIKERLQHVPAGHRIEEVSRMLSMIGKSLGVLVTVENLPRRGKPPANSRQPSQAA